MLKFSIVLLDVCVIYNVLKFGSSLQVTGCSYTDT
jgi:hypothetical protein